jgi:phosphoenolpyruvate-protein kinase (PTS system EI component)
LAHAAMMTRLLTNLGIDSISVNPTSLFRTTETVRAAEAVKTAAWSAILRRGDEIAKKS